MLLNIDRKQVLFAKINVEFSSEKILLNCPFDRYSYCIQHGAFSSFMVTNERGPILDNRCPTNNDEKRITTTKLAISAKENIQVEKLLRPRSKAVELDYLKEPIYESALPDETTAEKSKREKKRKQTPPNLCQAIEDQDPMIDNFRWHKIYYKV